MHVHASDVTTWMHHPGWQHEEHEQHEQHEQHDDAGKHDAVNGFHAEHADDAIAHDASLHANGSLE